MDSFTSSASGAGSSQFSNEEFMDKLKLQLAQAYAQEFLEVFNLFHQFPSLLFISVFFFLSPLIFLRHSFFSLLCAFFYFFLFANLCSRVRN